MRAKVVIILMMSILSACLVSCSEDDNIIPSNTSEPFVGSMDLDSETEKFFYGTWKVEKLLGFRFI